MTPATQAANPDSELVSTLLSHTVERLQAFLRLHNVPASGTKAQIQANVEEALGGGALSPDLIAAWLDGNEGWGQQHVYLYEVDDAVLRPLVEPATVERRLVAAGYRHPLNASAGAVLPIDRRLSRVSHDGERVRLVWCQRRAYWNRDENSDEESDDLQLRAYRRQVTRRLDAIELDLRTGHCLVQVQQLPKGDGYERERNALVTSLAQYLHVRLAEPLNLQRAVQSLSTAGAAQPHQLTSETRAGSRAKFYHARADADLAADQDIREVLDNYSTRLPRVAGAFLIPARTGIRVQIYRERRLGIFAECSEAQVRSAIDVIRRHL